MNVVSIVRCAKFAAVILAGLMIAGCAKQQVDQAGSAAAPGSQQDFVVNVGDRVFFETDSSELTEQARATLDKQAQWLSNYSRYAFTIEGHADERGTREYNIALGARRAQTVREYLTSRGIAAAAHAHHLLRQGAAGRGVRRHFLLVAEPPRGDGARSELVSGAAADFTGRGRDNLRSYDAPQSGRGPPRRRSRADFRAHRRAIVRAPRQCRGA